MLPENYKLPTYKILKNTELFNKLMIFGGPNPDLIRSADVNAAMGFRADTENVDNEETGFRGVPCNFIFTHEFILVTHLSPTLKVHLRNNEEYQRPADLIECTNAEIEEYKRLKILP